MLEYARAEDGWVNLGLVERFAIVATGAAKERWSIYAYFPSGAEVKMRGERTTRGDAVGLLEDKIRAAIPWGDE